MPTLLLPPRITDDSVRLWRAAGAAGWETIRLDRWAAPEGISPEEVVVYGGFFIALAGELGVSLLEPRVEWLAELSVELTRRRVRFMRLAQARRLRERAFYKPADDKCFLAKAYESGAELPAAGVLQDDVPVLVSEIVQWEMEFRCFVLDGRVVGISPYLRNGQRVDTPEGEFLATDEEFADAETFVASVVRRPDIGLPPGVVVDVGVIRGAGWAVIEANSAWGSGIYGCRASAILPVLRRVCVPTAGISEQDRRWAPGR
jgi:ATP-grasp domain, R2K clade family 3